jgi:hypothetical protein
MGHDGIVFHYYKIPALFGHLATIFGNFLVGIHHGSEFFLALPYIYQCP